MEPYSKIRELLRYHRPLFEALGDQTRQDILLLLACQERRSVGELTLHTNLSRPAVSHHLKILKEAGLLGETRKGTKRYYHATLGASITTLEQLMHEITQKKEMM